MDERFWEVFLDTYWEKEPAVIADPLSLRLLDRDEAFRAFLTAADRFRKGKRDGNIRVFRDSASCALELAEHLPVPEDGSLLAYLQRMISRPGSEKFGAVVNNVQMYLPELWQRLRDFTSGLYRAIGMPAQDVEAVLFMGNYDCTPFGVHRDFAGVFQFVLHGTKEMRLWDDRPLSARGFPFDTNLYGHDVPMFARAAGAPITLTAKQGQVMYWPSRFWHVGGGNGELAIGLSIGMFTNARVSEYIWRRIALELRKRFEGRDEVDYFSAPWSAEPPAVIRDRLRAIAEISASRELQQAMTSAWLERVTAFGCASVPPPRALEPLEDDAIVKSSRRYPILWSNESEDALLCAANGHTFRVPAHPRAIALLEHLNSGVEDRVGRLLDRFSGTAIIDDVEYEASPEGLRAVLEQLHAMRALERVSR